MNYMVLFKIMWSNYLFKKHYPEYTSNIAHSTQVTFTQIRVGFGNLNDDLYQKGFTYNESCDCGHIIEDSKHFFLICPLYNNPRRDMLNEVQMHNQARITPQLLINRNHCLNEGESSPCTLLQLCVNSLMNLNVLDNKLPNYSLN